MSDDTVQGLPGAGLGMGGSGGWGGALGRALRKGDWLPLCSAGLPACLCSVKHSSSDTSLSPFKEIKEELEDLNKEIKKTANKIRGKLKGKLAFLGAGGGWTDVGIFFLRVLIFLHFPK